MSKIIKISAVADRVVIVTEEKVVEIPIEEALSRAKAIGEMPGENKWLYDALMAAAHQASTNFESVAKIRYKPARSGFSKAWHRRHAAARQAVIDKIGDGEPVPITGVVEKI